MVAASAGNHAQGVALAAQLLGVDATVFMPEGAPMPKVEATRAYGADVRVRGQLDRRGADRGAASSPSATGAVLIHPFDHPDIVAGQGTVGLEILEQCPDVRTVLVCTGGGGLLAGIAVAVEGLRPDVRVVGVQAEGAAAFPGRSAAGSRSALADHGDHGRRHRRGLPGDVPFAIVREARRRRASPCPRSRCPQALLLLLERAKLVVEPAGAAAVAALLERPDALRAAGRRGAVGRQHRPAAAAAGAAARPRGRRALPRRSGCASPTGRARSPRLLGELAETDANVLDVVHVRTGARLHVDEVEVHLQVETRGGEHASACSAGCG